MSQILMVLDDNEIFKILRAKLVKKYEIDAIIIHSASEAISLMGILPDVELIICNDFIGKDPTASKICTFVVENTEEDAVKKKMVVLGEFSSPAYSQIFCVEKKINYEKLVEYVGFLIGKEEKNILEEDKLLQARREQEKIEEEKREVERLEKEKTNEQKREEERREQERKERIEQEKKEQAKIEQERQARSEQEKKEQAKRDQEEKERIDKIDFLRKEGGKREQRKKEEQEIRDKEKKEKQKREEERKDEERKEQLKKEKLEQEKIEQKKTVEGQRENEKREEAKRGRERKHEERLEEIKREKSQKELEEIERLEKIEKLRRDAEKRREHAKVAGKEPIITGERTGVFSLKAFKKAAEVVSVTPSSPDPTQEPPFQIEDKIVNPVYLPMNVAYFTNLPETEFDFVVYSRIQNANGFEFSKKFNSNTIISRAEMDRVLLRSGKDLYIAIEEIPKASLFLNKFFLEQFNQADLSLSDRLKLNSDSFEILLDLFKNLNFDKHNIVIIKELLKSINTLVSASNGMDLFLTGISEKKLSYGYCHSHLSLFLFLKMIDSFPWGKEQARNKLIYLCIFHDLGLQTSRLIKLHHNFKDEIKNLTEEESRLVLEHANDCAVVLEKIVKAPQELTMLLREHHGLKSGIGFINTLSFAITPPSMAFLVIEDFVTQYLHALEKMTVEEKLLGPSKELLAQIFSQLKVKYDRLTYAEVLIYLQKFMENL